MMNINLRYYLVVCVLLLTGCGAFQDGNNDEIPIQAGEDFELRIGQTAMLGTDTQITFNELASDSRCPLRVQCFWEGEINALFNVETNHAVNPIQFKGFLGNTGENPLEAQFDAFTLLLIRVDPYPEEGDGEIVATLRIIQVLS